eukprot:GGOE01014074.1.p1 GENE.GGOE01014074.1~~GGOE01014074.1.p1  ORF type:complete len:376 (-),score=84.96 GGOE01014074.1:217-1344(-)
MLGETPRTSSFHNGWTERGLHLAADNFFDEKDSELMRYVATHFTAEERQRMGICFHDTRRGTMREQFFAYLATNWTGFTLHHRDRVTHCVRQGIPDGLRGVIWQHMVDSKERQLRFPGLYAKLKAFPSGNERQIKRDLHRTFPDDPFFKERDGEGQRALFNVLNAHASFDSRTGYMQGMAFVVGFLLRYVSEETAFWMFVSLMQDSLYKLRLLYGPGVGGFLLMIFQVDKLVELYLPAIASHLASAHFNAEIYAPPFIPSLFVGRMSREAGARVLDLFLCEGDSVITRLFLGLLKYSEDEILTSEPERVLSILNATCENANMQRLLRLAFTFPVTHDMLESLEREYWEKAHSGRGSPLSQCSTGNSTRSYMDGGE